MVARLSVFGVPCKLIWRRQALRNLQEKSFLWSFLKSRNIMKGRVVVVSMSMFGLSGL